MKRALYGLCKALRAPVKQDIVCHVLASSTSLSLHLHYYPPPHYYVHQHYRDPYNCFFLPVLLLLVLVISIIITNSLVLSPNIIFSVVPSGSSSRGGAVTVYVLDINQPSLPTLFLLCSCVCYCLYDPKPTELAHSLFTLFLCLFLSLWP